MSILSLLHLSPKAQTVAPTLDTDTALVRLSLDVEDPQSRLPISTASTPLRLRPACHLTTALLFLVSSQRHSKHQVTSLSSLHHKSTIHPRSPIHCHHNLPHYCVLPRPAVIHISARASFRIIHSRPPISISLSVAHDPS